MEGIYELGEIFLVEENLVLLVGEGVVVAELALALGDGEVESWPRVAFTSKKYVRLPALMRCE